MYVIILNVFMGLPIALTTSTPVNRIVGSNGNIRSRRTNNAIVIITVASVAKWLRQWIVVPPLAGSSPVVRPHNFREMFCQKIFPSICLLLLDGGKRRGLFKDKLGVELLKRYSINIDGAWRSGI